MQKCSLCAEYKSEEEFGRQKMNPAKLYKWCQPCRRLNGRRNTAFSNEAQVMRQKTVETRKLSDSDIIEIKILRESFQMSIVDISSQYEVSKATVSKVLNRGYANV